MTDHSKSVRS